MIEMFSGSARVVVERKGEIYSPNILTKDLWLKEPYVKDRSEINNDYDEGCAPGAVYMYGFYRPDGVFQSTKIVSRGQ